MHPEPPPPRIDPADRLGAFLEILITSGFPTQLLLITALRAAGMSLQTPEGGLNPRFVFTLSLLDAVLVIALVVLLLRAHGESAREVLLGRVRMLKEAFVGIAMIPLAFLVLVLILGLVLTYAPSLRNVPRNPLEDMLLNRTDTAIFAVVVLVAGGVREEIQRGFILHRFERYLGGGAVGVVVHSLLFGAGHLEQGYDAAIVTATLGAFWGIVYLRRRSIVAPMVSHAGFNLAQIIKYVALR
ncbi:MAG TPA: CPBP family intramembrane glutamic endopeptidase [Vicinamibacterales bacterium]|nr:CPBP family intramembrane glutamic endopeptidase [Vicinamibacterales bacterium]